MCISNKTQSTQLNSPTGRFAIVFCILRGDKFINFLNCLLRTQGALGDQCTPLAIFHALVHLLLAVL